MIAGRPASRRRDLTNVHRSASSTSNARESLAKGGARSYDVRSLGVWMTWGDRRDEVIREAAGHILQTNYNIRKT